MAHQIDFAQEPAMFFAESLLPTAYCASDPYSSLTLIIPEQESIEILISALASERIISKNLIDPSELKQLLPRKPLTRPRHD